MATSSGALVGRSRAQSIANLATAPTDAASRNPIE
ncbi:hypothetical protein SAMN05216551_11425 [Chitinasiproducens palmae]|uniref:Uncharacterized protein n=1 Tax=Chitinasiproducens palmae TaxID=1770053 RepID=A0A1H2PUM9_9BURK|nr:hypothetical protein SAMN05216551_11425 [Chitinasiproducens palmae]